MEIVPIGFIRFRLYNGGYYKMAGILKSIKVKSNALQIIMSKAM